MFIARVPPCKTCPESRFDSVISHDVGFPAFMLHRLYFVAVIRDDVTAVQERGTRHGKPGRIPGLVRARASSRNHQVGECRATLSRHCKLLVRRHVDHDYDSEAWAGLCWGNSDSICNAVKEKRVCS